MSDDTRTTDLICHRIVSSAIVVVIERQPAHDWGSQTTKRMLSIPDPPADFIHLIDEIAVGDLPAAHS